jgi:hypothetical protein
MKKSLILEIYYRNRHKKDTRQTALVKHCKEKDLRFKNIKDFFFFFSIK